MVFLRKLIMANVRICQIEAGSVSYLVIGLLDIRSGGILFHAENIIWVLWRCTCDVCRMEGSLEMYHALARLKLNRDDHSPCADMMDDWLVDAVSDRQPNHSSCSRMPPQMHTSVATIAIPQLERQQP